MMTPEELISAVGALAADNGWALVHIERGPGGFGVVFEVNDSPYGALSSRARAKSKVAVISDAMTQTALALAERQREDSGDS